MKVGDLVRINPHPDDSNQEPQIAIYLGQDPDAHSGKWCVFQTVAKLRTKFLSRKLALKYVEVISESR